MKRRCKISLFASLLVLFLSSCGLSSPQLPEDTPIVKTQTPVILPSNGLSQLTSASATLAMTQASTPMPSSVFAQDFSITFVGETVPDGTTFMPGETFEKTWVIRNNGNRKWDQTFVFKRTYTSSSFTLDSPEFIPLPHEVNSGEEIQLTLDLIAPDQNGQFTVMYQLQDQNGWAMPNGELWVTITVGQPVVANTSFTSLNGVSVVLNSFVPGSQSATVSFCMSLPNRNYAPSPASVTMTIDQKTILAASGGSNGVNCFDFDFSVTQTEISNANHIQVSISQVGILGGVNDPQGACESARISLMNQYPGLDFTCNFTMAGYYTDLILPPGMTSSQADVLIVNTIEGVITGPWTMTIK